MKSYYWLNDDSRLFLSRGYIKEGETPEQRVKDIAVKAETILNKKNFAEKFEDYMSRGWYSLASPVWSNFGRPKVLPISCNGSFIPDRLYDILYKMSEVGAMTKNGAGTSGYFGRLRPRGSVIEAGGESFGPVHFMELFDKVTSIVSQSSIRRGSFAAYLPADHPDILEFLRIRSEGHPIQEMSFGVCITDDWMKSMIAGDKEKRNVWMKIVNKRYSSGYPYLFFTDTANKNAPQVYKDRGKKIWASNLCNEIALSSGPDESFVCDLSSMNAVHYREWEGTDAVETLTYFLDAVMEEYIEKTKDIPFLGAAYNFARRQRAIGIGLLGWHSFLQSEGVPFISNQADQLTQDIFGEIREKSREASRRMASEYGEPELLEGYGMRNVTTMAVAPTTSSSFILGQVSPSIEPLDSNYFVKDVAKGKFTYRNPQLVRVLKEKGQDKPEIWKGILTRGGSVQHLDFFSEREKDVFKTFREIDQKDLVRQAALRQKDIDQGQSLNLNIPPTVHPKESSSILVEGWKLGVKGFYYQRSANPSQELSRQIINSDSKECEVCAS